MPQAARRSPLDPSHAALSGRHGQVPNGQGKLSRRVLEVPTIPTCSTRSNRQSPGLGHSIPPAPRQADGMWFRSTRSRSTGLFQLGETTCHDPATTDGADVAAVTQCGCPNPLRSRPLACGALADLVLFTHDYFDAHDKYISRRCHRPGGRLLGGGPRSGRRRPVRPIAGLGFRRRPPERAKHVWERQDPSPYAGFWQKRAPCVVNSNVYPEMEDTNELSQKLNEKYR